MDPLLAFYRHQAPDHRGRWLQEIWRMSPSWLEQHHDYIQWLFPLPELSPVNPQAPRLTLEHRCEFLRDAALRQELGRSLQLMLNFFGLAADAGIWRPAPNAPRAQHAWLNRHNHNQLRITRMIRSLIACGLLNEGLQLQQCVLLAGQYRVSPQTLEFWRHAHEGLPPLPSAAPVPIEFPTSGSAKPHA